MKSRYSRLGFLAAAGGGFVAAAGLALAACGDSAPPREARDAIEAVCAGAPACTTDLTKRYSADEEVLVCTTISPGQANPVVAFAAPSSVPVGGACPDGRGLARAVIGKGAVHAEDRHVSELMRFLVWRASGLQTDRERLFAHMHEELQVIAGGLVKYTGCIAAAPVMDVARVVSKMADRYFNGEQIRLDLESRYRESSKGGEMKGRYPTSRYLTIGKDAAGRWVWYEPGVTCMPKF